MASKHKARYTLDRLKHDTALALYKYLYKRVDLPPTRLDLYRAINVAGYRWNLLHPAWTKEGSSNADQ